MSSTDLADAVPALKRAVAPPGRFAELFPTATAIELTAYLMDGLAEAQLDRFLLDRIVDEDGVVTEALTAAQVALVVIYSSTRILASEIRDRRSHIQYVAGPASFEEDQAASVMVELLKQMDARKKELKLEEQRGGSADAFAMADLYLARVTGDPYLLGG